MARENGFPIFMLGIVLLPTESTVLHVFEERYKELTNLCIEESRQFGVVYTDGQDGAPSEFGCATHIDRVIERFDDGRMNVVVTGIEPIRLVEMEGGLSYPSAAIERLTDSVGPESADGDQLDRTRAAYAALVEAISGEPPDADETDLLYAYEMAAQVNLDESDKLLLLESRDEDVRLASLEGVFTAGAKSVAETRELASRAKTNGHGRYPRSSE